MSRFLIILDGISTITHGTYQYIIDGIFVGTFAKSFLIAMRHIHSLRHSCLITKFAVALSSMMLRRLFPWCLQLGRTPVLNLFLRGTLMDSSLLELTGASFEDASLFICTTVLLLFYLN